LRSVPYEQLQAGVYEVADKAPHDICPGLDYGCPGLSSVFTTYTQRINRAATRTDLPKNEQLPNAQAVMLIEDWQTNLKQITMRITWDDVDTGNPKTYEKVIFLHHDRER
jgi:hypothetical protein